MARSAFRLNEFISQVKNGSLARTNRFEVIINQPLYVSTINSFQTRKVSLFCEISNFPPINISVRPFKIFGPTYQRPTTSEYGGDGISMIFHVDRDMYVKRFFDDWIEKVVSRDDFTVAYQKDYVQSIYIRQLDEADNVTYEIELLDAFPRSMNLLELNNSAQNQTHRLNIIFAYRYWRRTDIPQNKSSTLQQVPVVGVLRDPIRNLPTYDAGFGPARPESPKSEDFTYGVAP